MEKHVHSFIWSTASSMSKLTLQHLITKGLIKSSTNDDRDFYLSSIGTIWFFKNNIGFYLFKKLCIMKSNDNHSKNNIQMSNHHDGLFLFYIRFPYKMSRST